MLVHLDAEAGATPIDSPAYPPPPSHYDDVTMQMVHFTTAPENIPRMLPGPLTPDPSGRCCAFAIEAKFCAQLGAFREVGVAVGCVYDQRPGYFLSSHFVNTAETIAPGRELYGSPKKYAEITVDQQGGEWTTTVVRTGIPIIQINMRLLEPAQPNQIPSLFPLYKLRMIPSATGGRPDVNQLLCGGAPSNMKSGRQFQGPGVVNFTPSVAGAYWKLRPLSYETAIYQRCSYEQGLSEVVLEYSPESLD